MLLVAPLACSLLHCAPRQRRNVPASCATHLTILMITLLKDSMALMMSLHPSSLRSKDRATPKKTEKNMMPRMFISVAAAAMLSGIRSRSSFRKASLETLAAVNYLVGAYEQSVSVSSSSPWDPPVPSTQSTVHKIRRRLFTCACNAWWCLS